MTRCANAADASKNDGNSGDDDATTGVAVIDNIRGVVEEVAVADADDGEASGTAEDRLILVASDGVIGVEGVPFDARRVDGWVCGVGCNAEAAEELGDIACNADNVCIVNGCGRITSRVVSCAGVEAALDKTVSDKLPSPTLLPPTAPPPDPPLPTTPPPPPPPPLIVHNL